MLTIVPLCFYRSAGFVSSTLQTRSRAGSVVRATNKLNPRGGIRFAGNAYPNVKKAYTRHLPLILLTDKKAVTLCYSL